MCMVKLLKKQSEEFFECSQLKVMKVTDLYCQKKDDDDPKCFEVIVCFANKKNLNLVNTTSLLSSL